MRGVARAGVDGRERFVVGRAGVADRHAMAGRDEIANEIEPAGQLRRERHDANARRDARDHREISSPVKSPFGPFALRTCSVAQAVQSAARRCTPD